MAPVLYEFFKGQLFARMILPEASLEGRTVIVTGSNIGLGFHTALHFANMKPAKLILAVRDLQKGEAAKTTLSEQTGCTNVEVWKLDLSSFDSVKAFAKRANEELSRLDIVVENAGVATFKFSLTGDGNESTLQVNDLSTGLLGLLLLPLLQKTSRLPNPTPTSTLKPHLVIVGSEVHFWANFKEQTVPGSTIEALNDEKTSAMGDRYNVSKLLNVFIARQFSKLPIAKGVVVNVANPGLCVSELRREMPGVVAWLFNKVSRATEEGAKNFVWAGIEDTSEIDGAYISNCRVTPPSVYCQSEAGLAMEKKVFGEMAEIWKKTSPEAASLLEV